MKKVVVVFICILLFLSVSGCSRTPENPSSKTNDPTSLYNGILSRYTALLTAKHNGETLPEPDTDGMNQREAAIIKALYGIVDNLNDPQSAENMGYGFKDMDGNGTPELILLTRYTSVMAVFTVSGNAPVLLEAGYGEGNNIYFATGNRFFIMRDSVNGNVEERRYSVCRVEGDRMVYDSVYGETYDRDKKETLEYYQIVDGNRIVIGAEDFARRNLVGEKINIPGYTIVSKLSAPRIRYPLINASVSDDLPVADFSNYAVIRETYLKISAALEKFVTYQWVAGKYDDLFAIADDKSFEIYNRLLYAAYHGDGNVGYDEIDLNGDGQDELVLLGEDYRIKAVFTQKNGVPVLLDAFAYETCWLDDKGLIHVDNEQVSELEYSLYEFTKSGDYDLVYSILVTDNGSRYLTEGNRTEPITFEQSLTLYHDEYCRYSEPFEPYEQTRNVSPLTYTPLRGDTGDLILRAENQTWHKFSNLEKTTGKDFARSSTYVTFESTNDDQIKMTVKYQFIFSYPDPDRDHYLLDDTTESVLEITAVHENGVAVFDGQGIKGRIEFGQKFVWIIIDESTDSRFPVGHHCYAQYSPDQFIG